MKARLKVESLDGRIVPSTVAYGDLNLDGLIECFDKDASLMFTSDAARTAKGRTAIRAFYETARGKRRTARQQTRHTICNILIENETADQFIARVNKELNLLFIQGSVPGPINGFVTIRRMK